MQKHDIKKNMFFYSNLHYISDCQYNRKRYSISNGCTILHYYQ